MSWDSNSEANPDFLNRLVVIITDVSSFGLLCDTVESLAKSMPSVLSGVQFVFNAGEPTNSELRKLFKTHDFFKRSDIAIVSPNPGLRNMTSDEAILQDVSKNVPDSDIVLLRAGTKVFPGLFPALRGCASAYPDIATVTPLSNEIVPVFEPASSEAMAQFLSNLKTAPVTVENGLYSPCVYICRGALQRVGLPANQENWVGWAQKAEQLGFKSLLVPSAYVVSPSTSENTRALCQGDALERLKFVRCLCTLGVIKQFVNRVYLLTLHSDPETVFVGGTEAHVRHLRDLLVGDGAATLILAPVGERRFVLRGKIGSRAFVTEYFHEDSLPNLLALVQDSIDCLHVHHAMGWPRQALDALANCSIPRKLVTVHDFWFICPSINLLAGFGRDRFCEVESDLNKCNECLASVWHHGNETIQSYRASFTAFLRHFDLILVPSASVVDYLKKAFAPSWPLFVSKVKVLHHDLSYLTQLQPLGNTTQKPASERISFIGAIGQHKGSKLLIDAIPDLQKMGIEVEILGSIREPSEHDHLKNVRVALYKNATELRQLLSRDGGPQYIGSISIWAETFSYTFFEGLMLCPTAIPVVGPYGNPAQVCRENGLGPVMKSCSSAALIEAVGRARLSRESYRAKVESFTAELRRKCSERTYLSTYLAAVSEINAQPRKSAFPNILLENASSLEVLLWQREGLLKERNSTLIRAARKIRLLLRHSNLVVRVLKKLIPGQRHR